MRSQHLLENAKWFKALDGDFALKLSLSNLTVQLLGG